MTKLASHWSVVVFALLASQLVSSCGMDAGQNKPVATASGNTAVTSQATQPIVADRTSSVADSPNGPMVQTNQSPTSTQPGPGAAFASAEATEYRISPQDILQISVFQVNDLNSAVQVNQDGSITLPLVGKIRVAGETTVEAEQTIAGKLRQKYMQSPQVSVSVKTYGKRITVSGEVKGPRVLSDDGQTTLSQAIANAGGTSELANTERVHVARSKDQHVQDEIYNLDDVQAGKATDPQLRGGDIIVVEQSGVKVALKDMSALLPFAIVASIF
jgi:polysaccharide biosynthesis/export protein